LSSSVFSKHLNVIVRRTWCHDRMTLAMSASFFLNFSSAAKQQKKTPGPRPGIHTNTHAHTHTTAKSESVRENSINESIKRERCVVFQWKKRSRDAFGASSRQLMNDHRSVRLSECVNGRPLGTNTSRTITF